MQLHSAVKGTYICIYIRDFPFLTSKGLSSILEVLLFNLCDGSLADHEDPTCPCFSGELVEVDGKTQKQQAEILYSSES